MSVVPLIFAHNNDQDVVKQRLNAKSSVDSSLKYCISQFMAENEVKFWPGDPSIAPCKMNTWFYFPPMAIHYSLSEGIHFYIQNFLLPTPWIPQTIHFGRLFILRVIHFERDHCIGRIRSYPVSSVIIVIEEPKTNFCVRSATLVTKRMKVQQPYTILWIYRILAGN